MKNTEYTTVITTELQILLLTIRLHKEPLSNLNKYISKYEEAFTALYNSISYKTLTIIQYKRIINTAIRVIPDNVLLDFRNNKISEQVLFKHINFIYGDFGQLVTVERVTEQPVNLNQGITVEILKQVEPLLFAVCSLMFNNFIGKFILTIASYRRFEHDCKELLDVLELPDELVTELVKLILIACLKSDATFISCFKAGLITEDNLLEYVSYGVNKRTGLVELKISCKLDIE